MKYWLFSWLTSEHRRLVITHIRLVKNILKFVIYSNQTFTNETITVGSCCHFQGDRLFLWGLRQNIMFGICSSHSEHWGKNYVWDMFVTLDEVLLRCVIMFLIGFPRSKYVTPSNVEGTYAINERFYKLPLPVIQGTIVGFHVIDIYQPFKYRTPGPRLNIKAVFPILKIRRSRDCAILHGDPLTGKTPSLNILRRPPVDKVPCQKKSLST